MNSLLVLLDNGTSCAARTHLAMRLARERDDHLVGLAPTGLIDIPASSEAAMPFGAYAALAWDALRDQAEEAAQRFRDACATAGVSSFEVVLDEADTVQSILRHAHCSDLLVLSQARASPPGRRREQDNVEQVILHSARPTLVVPHTGQFEHVGHQVLVAWDDSREASRALSDALPVLRTSKRVDVVRWRESDKGDDDKTMRARLDAVHRWLLVHRVPCHIYIESSHGRLAESMLARASEIDADLIVMGAYGHSRWTERVLGGATRDMLDTMTVPVLMSH